MQADLLHRDRQTRTDFLCRRPCNGSANVSIPLILRRRVLRTLPLGIVQCGKNHLAHVEDNRLVLCFLRPLYPTSHHPPRKQAEVVLILVPSKQSLLGAAIGDYSYPDRDYAGGYIGVSFYYF